MYEYRVVAAPNRGVKAKGIKSNEARFAHALEELMNSMAQEGWEYQRAETLPSVERAGLTSTTTTWRNLLIFRRPAETTDEQEQDVAVADALSAPVPLALDAPKPNADAENKPEDTERKIPPLTSPQSPEDDASQSEGASRMLRDNGVEELSEVSGITSSLKQLAENRNTSKSDD